MAGLFDRQLQAAQKAYYTQQAQTAEALGRLNTPQPALGAGMYRAGQLTGDLLFEGLSGNTPWDPSGAIGALNESTQGILKETDFTDSKSLRQAAGALMNAGALAEGKELLDLATDAERAIASGRRGVKNTEWKGADGKIYNKATWVDSLGQPQTRWTDKNGNAVTAPQNPRLYTKMEASLGARQKLAAYKQGMALELEDKKLNDSLTKLSYGYAYDKKINAYKSFLANGEVSFKNALDIGEDKRADAGRSVVTLDNIQAQLKLLNSGKMNTGTFAKARTLIQEAAETLGFINPDGTVAVSEAYQANGGALVGDIIRLFGAGTGLSDKDREFAQMIVGQNIDLSEDGLRKILQLVAEREINNIKSTNKYFDDLPDAYFESPYVIPREKSKVDIPELDFSKPKATVEKPTAKGLLPPSEWLEQKRGR